MRCGRNVIYELSNRVVSSKCTNFACHFGKITLKNLKGVAITSAIDCKYFFKNDT